ncbi:Protein patched-like 2 [Stylophora pistillata]|uniref:Protein patched-like 2 n=1 Tax=Stylophora pistillata TaxID=50429 RepID=A0A2B4SYJ7_STYPI|nr:Protein patched-like 2 [Stylophora pistillata]
MRRQHPYKQYKRIDDVLDVTSPEEFEAELRFGITGLPLLLRALAIPEVFTCANSTSHSRLVMDNLETPPELKVEPQGEPSIARTKEITTGAKALQMIYLIRAPSEDDAYEGVFNWETKFIEKIASLVDKLSGFEVHLSSERSMDDAIDESTGSDVTLVSITFTLMISFACIMLGKFFNPLTGHSLLAVAGVFAVGLGILAGLGLGMWFRVPFVSFVGILPFLVLGIGIDDMFIMVDELDRLPRDLSTPKKIKAVMRHTGTTVTMTTITDLVAFAVSTSTSFPAVRDSQRQYLDANFKAGQAKGVKIYPVDVARDILYARNQKGEKLFTVSEFLTEQETQSHFSRRASKLRHSPSDDPESDQDEDIMAAEEEIAHENVRSVVLKEVGFLHPIVFYTFNLCDKYKVGKLRQLSVSMLHSICKHFGIEVMDIKGRRKAPYLSPLENVW